MLKTKKLKKCQSSAKRFPFITELKINATFGVMFFTHPLLECFSRMSDRRRKWRLENRNKKGYEMYFF